MGENTDLHDPEEAEEALSLSDLPLDDSDNDFQDLPKPKEFRRASSEPTEFFEFFNDMSSDNYMCPAEDIIFCGKLIPFKEPSPTNIQTLKPLTQEDKKQAAFRRRSESLSELQTTSVTRSNSTHKSNLLMRNSRSLDYRKLNRLSSSNSSHESGILERNSSVKSVGKSDMSAKKAVKPRWYYLFMFGMVKFPTEMELSDIKSRQFRRNPSVMFPSVNSAGKNFPVHRSSNKGSSKFLKALSCKGHASVAVTASFCMPQV